MKHSYEINDMVAFRDLSDHSKKGLRGTVSIYRRNKTTGETSLWYQADNIIPISGMQWTLMKMFGLYLDAPHGVDYERLSKDTNLVIPELNQDTILGIGTDPTMYTTMNENLASNHIVQGFMIGNGGSGEDQMTTKNTDYSFINLRNPIPFRQTNEPLTDGKYLGKIRVGTHAYTNSYYIKSFEQTPHIYNGWWRDGQKWDEIDPVTQDDLGPNAANGAGKTNRIETYVECKLVLDENDCIEYFSREGNTQTPAINELGLVAYDTTANSTRLELKNIYDGYIKPIINMVFMDGLDDAEALKTLATTAVSLLSAILPTHSQSNIDALYALLQTISSAETIDKNAYRTELASDSDIGVVAYYTNTDGYKYSHSTDSFMEYLNDDAFNDDTEIEAQRIKLVTYYTFPSIIIQENWETLINYRIYAN